MSNYYFDKLTINRMPSGNLCLELTEKISWKLFEKYAYIFLDLIGGKLLKKNDTVDIRLWIVEINNENFYLVYDDFPIMMGIESQSKKGDKIINDIQYFLSEKTSSSE